MIKKIADLYTKEHEDILRICYLTYRDLGQLNELAKILKRSKADICRRATQLKLTKQQNKKSYLAVWKYMSEETAGVILEKFKKSPFNRIDFCKKNRLGLTGFEYTIKKFFPVEYDNLIKISNRSKKYNKGRSFEYKVRDKFQSLGYFTIRSAGSKTPVDLIALKKGELLFIQCKNSTNWYQVKEWNVFFELAISVDAIPIIALKGMQLNRIISLKGASKCKNLMKPYFNKA